MPLIDTLRQSKNEPYAIGIIWLFHVSGIIGSALGYSDWFTPKTPLLLSLLFFILVIFYPVKEPKFILGGIIFFLAGMLVEWIGIRHDFLFGSYYYGENLGPKIGGVPYLIGANWMILVFVTSYISGQVTRQPFFKILLGSSLMVFLDFFIEPAAPRFDFWIWTEGAPPLRNFTSWFLIAFVLHGISEVLKIQSKSVVSWHIYLSQLVFFVYFYGFH